MVCTRGTYGGRLPCCVLVSVVTNVKAVHEKPPRTAAGPPRTTMVVLLTPRRERLLRLLPHTGVGKRRPSRAKSRHGSTRFHRSATGGPGLCCSSHRGRVLGADEASKVFDPVLLMLMQIFQGSLPSPPHACYAAAGWQAALAAAKFARLRTLDWTRCRSARVVRWLCPPSPRLLHPQSLAHRACRDVQQPPSRSVGPTALGSRKPWASCRTR